MSSRPLFANLAYRDAYVSKLRRGLPESFQPFAAFFGNLERLATLAAMLDGRLGKDALTLNVGCGPFAAEIFVPALQGGRVVSFDYTAEFAPFLHAFRADGHLANTLFLRADALTVAFRPASFDAILIHDVLYETGLDLGALLARHVPALKPGGLVYLDVMDTRLGRLWRLLGKERDYRRYRLDDVTATLEAHGLRLVETRPAIGARRGPVRLAHQALWRATGLSNAVGMIAEKTTS